MGRGMTSQNVIDELRAQARVDAVMITELRAALRYYEDVDREQDEFHGYPSPSRAHDVLAADPSTLVAEYEAAKRTLRTIATMLGWMNVPPRTGDICSEKPCRRVSCRSGNGEAGG